MRDLKRTKKLANLPILALAIFSITSMNTVFAKTADDLQTYMVETFYQQVVSYTNYLPFKNKPN